MKFEQAEIAFRISRDTPSFMRTSMRPLTRATWRFF